MAGYAKRDINFHNEAFLQWLTERPRGVKERYRFTPQQIVLDRGLKVVAERFDVSPGFTTIIPTGVKRRYALYKEREFRQNFTLQLVVINTFTVEINARLYIKNSAPVDVTSALSQLFNTFNPKDDIEQACRDLLVQYNAKPDEFELELFPTCELSAITIDDRAEQELYHLYTKSPPPVLVHIPGEGSLRSRGYNIVRLGDTPLSEAPQPSSIPNAIVKRPGMTERDIEEAVEEAAKREAERVDCPPDYTDKIKLASMNGIPESRVVWRKRQKGGVCPTWVDEAVVEWRDTEYALYATVTYRELDKRFKQTIEECARQAAIEGAILGLALENFQVAITTFISRFKTLIYERTHQIFDCLMPQLHVVTTNGEWH